VDSDNHPIHNIHNTKGDTMTEHKPLKTDGLFDKTGFWNMPSVKISEKNQIEQVRSIEPKERDCRCGQHHGTNKDCSYCKQYAEQQTILK